MATYIQDDDIEELDELADLYTVTKPTRVPTQISGPIEIELPSEELDLVDLIEMEGGR